MTSEEFSPINEALAAQSVLARYRANDRFCNLAAFAYDLNTLLREEAVLSKKQSSAVKILDEAIA